MPVKRTVEKIPAVTMRDVAEKCGVSAATVSIVLNGAPLARHIAPATKLRVKNAVKALGYRPNAMARYLRSSRSKTIGLMFFDITDPFCTPILRGVENALYQVSYVPIITDAHNQAERFERYLEMMLERQVEGLIVVANWLYVDINLLSDLARRSVPVVTIGWEAANEPVSSVMVDNEAGMRQAMEHLYLLGHRKIAFIRGPKSLIDSDLRWSGAQRFAQSVGLEIDPNLVLELPDKVDPNFAFESAGILTRELLATKQPFTALMAFDDLTAFGAIRTLAGAGVKVPGDCSVVGFDNVAPGALLTPSLTTVAQPLERMGTMAVSIVLDGVKASLEKSEQTLVRHRLIPALIVRESTGAPPR